MDLLTANSDKINASFRLHLSVPSLSVQILQDMTLPRNTSTFITDDATTKTHMQLSELALCSIDVGWHNLNISMLYIIQDKLEGASHIPSADFHLLGDLDKFYLTVRYLGSSLDSGIVGIPQLNSDSITRIDSRHTQNGHQPVVLDIQLPKVTLNTKFHQNRLELNDNFEFDVECNACDVSMISQTAEVCNVYVILSVKLILQFRYFLVHL
jgi:hypothetical protein